MDREFCLQALDNALRISNPEIFNTDQGSQFTSTDFTDRLKNAGIRISMDGRGRAYDNIFVERLWRTVKYEEVYLRDYRTVLEAKHGLAQYFRFYNTERRHQTLNYRTPYETNKSATPSPLLVVIPLFEAVPANRDAIFSEGGVGAPTPLKYM